MRRLLYEIRIAVHPALWALPAVFAAMRLAGMIWHEGWLPLMEIAYPILFPLLAVVLLESERRRKTAEVLISTPVPKPRLLIMRLGAALVPLLGIAAATLPPSDWLTVLPAGVLLAGVALVVGLLCGTEIGLAVALGWWGLSFAASLGVQGILANPVANWFLLILGGAPLSPGALVLRKAVHLGAGVGLIVVCALLVGRRCWRGLSR